MACSRTPKRRLRPARLSGSKLPLPSMSVSVLGARSASPPINSGRWGARALITLPEATRVARGTSVRAKRGQVSVPPLRELPLHDPLELRGQFGIFLRIGPEPGLPLRLPRRSPLRELAEVFQGLRRDVEGRFDRPAQVFLGQAHFFHAQRFAVGRRRVVLVRAAVADVRVDIDERRTAFFRPRSLDGRGEGGDVVAVLDPLGMPAIRRKACQTVLGEDQIGAAPRA